MATLDFQSRAAMTIGMVVMAYSKVDQQIYWQIGHLKTERAERERKKGSIQDPPDEELSGDFDRRTSLWRRLCRTLSADNENVMPEIDDMIRRLKLAVAVRDDLVHGWISPEPITGEDVTGLRIMNAHDVNQFSKRLQEDQRPQPSAFEKIYSFDQLHAVKRQFDELYWELIQLTERVITEFR